MQEDTHEDDNEKAMATLNNCFLLTEETGETMEEDVSPIAFLKYITTHKVGEIIFSHVYQGKSLFLIHI